MADRLIDPRHAWELLLPYLHPLPAETVPRRRALGRVLAEPLVATVDVPASDVSAMDGYALTGPVGGDAALEVCGVVAAGDPPGLRLPPGQACRIMTGAPVPEAADRVVPVEQTDGGSERVRVTEDPGAGAHIRRRGEVQRAGEELLPAGSRLVPGALSLLATHGHGEVPVHRAPRVRVLATGDEVVPPERTPGPGQLRDSHTDFLLAAGATLGLEIRALGIAPDRPEELRRDIERGLEGDVLLLCGGVSKGEFDFAEDVLAELGYRTLFDAVAVKPGKPLVAAVPEEPGRALVFGLPGNPASVMVCFWLFVRPALRRLLGLEDGWWQGAVEGELAAPLPGAKGRDHFLAATVRFEDGRLKVVPRRPEGSHDLAAYARGSALVRIPAHAEPAPAGAPCQVLPLADWPADPRVR